MKTTVGTRPPSGAIPAGGAHDFENRSRHDAAVLNVYMPGGFEDMMPDIVQWFRDNPTWSGV
jgi:hypothetical protein